MTPEWSRPERVDAIGETPRAVAIEADCDERRRLAGRFGLVAIDRLAASFTLAREGAAIVATGRVAAAVVQACSISGDPLPASVDEAVCLRFVEGDGGGEEVELSGDDLDTLPIEDGAIDLGEAAAATMALALDPFPRGPGAAAAAAAAGIVGEDAGGGAFGALAALKGKLR